MLRAPRTLTDWELALVVLPVFAGCRTTYPRSALLSNDATRRSAQCGILKILTASTCRQWVHSTCLLDPTSSKPPSMCAARWDYR